MALKYASLAFTAVPRQGTWTLKVRLVARQLPFGARLLHWQVEGLVDGQKLGGGGYLGIRFSHGGFPAAPLLSGRVGIERHPRERFALKITESMQTSNTLPAATRCFCDILSQWLIYDVVPLVFAPAGFLAILRPPRCRIHRKRAVQGHYRLTAQPLSPEGVKRLPA
ncbi:hypothetical protein CY34DRAFT_10723 [Suillus luteus UH-Slu-Lm8-n1]|uniref:Uncharacterized protein n=1 Tax=Suillus luteus UH-Slu-Lm8-n1 TaxID=930992 RepID=A0A0D0B4Y2_9AGAM|nr:hypothetical protein CY34DRAFT_10723 [Suillus luteus UH-Slu-Lm8-n1]